MIQLGFGQWFLVVPANYDGLPGEGYLVQAWDANDAVRELGMGPVEYVGPDPLEER